MGAPRVLPRDATLLAMVESGMTHQQIADHVAATTGVKVSRAAVSLALSRAGVTANQRSYKDVVPWRVAEQFQDKYPVRMLRLLGRRRRGEPLSEDQVKRLDSWLGQLEAEDLVVAYAPSTPTGLIYVVADEPGDRPDGIPIRPRQIRPEEVSG